MSRYDEIFYIKPEFIKISRDHKMEKFAKDHPEHWIPTGKNGAIYKLYFNHEEYPFTIGTYIINWGTYKHRFALTKEELENDK